MHLSVNSEHKRAHYLSCSVGRIKRTPPHFLPVGHDLTDATGTFDVTWISVAMGMTTQTSAAGGYLPMRKTIQGGSVVTFSAPYKGGWVAVIVNR